MKDKQHIIHDNANKPITINIKRDKRLKKSARWEREDKETILLRIPYRMPKKYLKDLLADVEKQVKRQSKKAKRRTDEDLQNRAKHINKKYLDNKVSWEAIRWVGNMNQRMGSCTNGGPTDGHIRISDKIKKWPQWVIDYVIAHELTHRLHPDHSTEFWAALKSAYPLTEQARGFIKGIAFSQGETDWEEN